jgi:hypothetical protein
MKFPMKSRLPGARPIFSAEILKDKPRSYLRGLFSSDTLKNISPKTLG